MKDIGKLMKQAKEMQERLTSMQQELANLEIEGRSGGGFVRVAMNGEGLGKRVHIDPEVFKADEAEILEDVVAAAVNDARDKVEARRKEEMQKLTGGLPLPPGLQF